MLIVNTTNKDDGHGQLRINSRHVLRHSAQPCILGLGHLGGAIMSAGHDMAAQQRDVYKAQCDALKAQNAELLAALTELLHVSERVGNAVSRPANAKARAALAKVQQS